MTLAIKVDWAFLFLIETQEFATGKPAETTLKNKLHSVYSGFLKTEVHQRNISKRLKQT